MTSIQKIFAFTFLASGVAFLSCGKTDNGLKGSWSVISDAAPAPVQRMLHTAVWTGDAMVVFGGYEPGGLGYTIKGDGFSYNPNNDTWAAVATPGVALGARAQHTAIWTGTEMLVWGGVDADRKALASGAKYNPKTNAWTAMSAVNAPSGRMRHTDLPGVSLPSTMLSFFMQAS